MDKIIVDKFPCPYNNLSQCSYFKENHTLNGCTGTGRCIHDNGSTTWLEYILYGSCFEIRDINIMDFYIRTMALQLRDDIDRNIIESIKKEYYI